MLLQRMTAHPPCSCASWHMAAAERSVWTILDNSRVTAERVIDGWGDQTGAAAEAACAGHPIHHEINFHTIPGRRRGLGRQGRRAGPAAAPCRLAQCMAFCQQARPPPLSCPVRAGVRYGVEIDLAGVLDGQHMPACRCRAGLITPSVDHPFSGHPRVIEKSSNPTSSARCPCANWRRHTLDAQSCAGEASPPFVRRRSQIGQ